MYFILTHSNKFYSSPSLIDIFSDIPTHTHLRHTHTHTSLTKPATGSVHPLTLKISFLSDPSRCNPLLNGLPNDRFPQDLTIKFLYAVVSSQFLCPAAGYRKQSIMKYSKVKYLSRAITKVHQTKNPSSPWYINRIYQTINSRKSVCNSRYRTHQIIDWCIIYIESKSHFTATHYSRLSNACAHNRVQRILFLIWSSSSTSRPRRHEIFGLQGGYYSRKVRKRRLPQGQMRRMADLHQEAWVKSLSVVTLCCTCSTVRLCARNFTHDVVCATSPRTAWTVVYRLTCS